VGQLYLSLVGVHCLFVAVFGIRYVVFVLDDTGILYDILERQARRGLVSSYMVTSKPIGIKFEYVSHVMYNLHVLMILVHYIYMYTNVTGFFIIRLTRRIVSKIAEKGILSLRHVYRVSVWFITFLFEVSFFMRRTNMYLSMFHVPIKSRGV